MQTTAPRFKTVIIGIVLAASLVLGAFPGGAHATTLAEYVNLLQQAVNNRSLTGSQLTVIRDRLDFLSSGSSDAQAYWDRLGTDGQAAAVAGLNSYVTGAAGRSDAVAERKKKMQDDGSCIPLITFEFTRCIADPLAKWAGAAMLSLGAAILRLSGSIFDFGINHLIINFKDTLEDKLHLMDIIKQGWTFFRDLANILLIGIFVFIAISLILGLKEYGQKRLIARVLIIAVLMNFSLLFTKIVIDTSNFIAFAIYAQTAGSGGAGTFSIADKVLKPLHVTGVWDTGKLTESVFAQSGPEESGAFRVFAFGLFGFMILTVLGLIIAYGAFLILARALLLVFLMLTAPIAYASYLAPHFEASEFGWTNWWKSLINNAAFAPLLMMFLSISILIFGTASVTIDPAKTFGVILTDPPRELVDSWKVLMVYIIGTGLLYTSFRMASSIAGSISGIQLGKMGAMVPFALGGAAAGKFLQRTAGYGLSKAADSKGAQVQAARMQALRSGKAEDWARVEQLRKQKAMLDKGAKSSFNLMNTQLGKALAGNAGLKGKLAGETKGGFNDTMHAKAVAAEERAKAAQVSAKDKEAMRKEATEAEMKAHEDDLKTARANLDTAKAELDKARTENASASDPVLVKQAEAEVEKNRSERAPEIETREREVRVVQEKRGAMEQEHKQTVEVMMQQAEKMSGDAKERHLQKIEEVKAAHLTAIKSQDQHITDARQKVDSLKLEVDAPIAGLRDRQEKAARALTDRKKAFDTAETTMTKLNSRVEARVKDRTKADVKTAEANSKEQTHAIATKAAGRFGNAHVVEHHFEEKFKSKTGAQSIKEAIESMSKKDDAGGGGAHA